LRFGTPRKNKPATLLPPIAANQIAPPREPAARELPGITFAAVEVIVKVDVALVAELLRATDVGLREQPTVVLLDEQVRDTVPEKPLAALAVRVDVPVAPGEAMVAAVLDKE
jgi:hypothetical protein